MSSSLSCVDLFRRIYIEQDLGRPDLLNKALEKLKGLPITIVQDKHEIPEKDLNQHTLFICRPKGETVTRCPGSNWRLLRAAPWRQTEKPALVGHLCCNYITVDLYLGCPLGCEYCIMKSYLNFSPVTVYLDPEVSISKIKTLARRNYNRVLRVGTGETGDSLLLDPVFELSKLFIRSLASITNLYFELKTKTHFVDHLLNIEPKGNTVIGFSLNPQSMISAYEGISSSLEQRIEAARKAAENDYYISFHFDPLILTENWEELYETVIDSLRGIPSDKIAWISMGTMRYTEELKEKLCISGIQDFFLEEFVPCRDGKYRYLQRVRSEIYRYIYEKLRCLFSGPVYLCMESPAVWNNVFGKIPREIPGVRDIFKHAEGLK